MLVVHDNHSLAPRCREREPPNHLLFPSTRRSIAEDSISISGPRLVAAFRFDQKHPVQAGAVILHGDGRREFHELFFTEMDLRLGVNFIADRRGRQTYGFGNFKGRPFCRRKQRAVAPTGDAGDFLVRTSRGAAPGSVGVYSERTGDNLRRPQANQIANFSRQCVAFARRRAQRAAGLENGGAARLDTGGGRRLAGTPRRRLQLRTGRFRRLIQI